MSRFAPFPEPLLEGPWYKLLLNRPKSSNLSQNRFADGGTSWAPLSPLRRQVGGLGASPTSLEDSSNESARADRGTGLSFYRIQH